MKQLDRKCMKPIKLFKDIPSGTFFKVKAKPRTLWFKCENGVSVNDDTMSPILFKDNIVCVIER